MIPRDREELGEFPSLRGACDVAVQCCRRSCEGLSQCIPLDCRASLAMTLKVRGLMNSRHCMELGEFTSLRGACDVAVHFCRRSCEG
jgi:hypothetical protein